MEARGQKLAAFFCEPVLSCAGQVFLPDGYLAEVYDEMRKHGAVCIGDEVQCGFGRLGEVFWGFEMHVRPFSTHLYCDQLLHIHDGHSSCRVLYRTW